MAGGVNSSASDTSRMRNSTSGSGRGHGRGPRHVTSHSRTSQQGNQVPRVQSEEHMCWALVTQRNSASMAVEACDGATRVTQHQLSLCMSQPCWRLVTCPMQSPHLLAPLGTCLPPDICSQDPVQGMPSSLLRSSPDRRPPNVASPASRPQQWPATTTQAYSSRSRRGPRPLWLSRRISRPANNIHTHHIMKNV